MNKYKITFTVFPITDGKISIKNHFSGCRTTIEGETFEEAVKQFKEEQWEKGMVIDFVVEGDLFNITFEDLK